MTFYKNKWGAISLRSIILCGIFLYASVCSAQTIPTIPSSGWSNFGSSGATCESRSLLIYSNCVDTGGVGYFAFLAGTTGNTGTVQMTGLVVGTSYSLKLICAIYNNTSGSLTYSSGVGLTITGATVFSGLPNPVLTANTPWAHCNTEFTANASSATINITQSGSGWSSATNKLYVALQSQSLTVAPSPPTVTLMTPNSGSTVGGTSVTITGTNFTGATGVTIGGVAATGVSVVSATSITATTPAGTAGTASVVVTTPVGSNAANTLFTYVAPPTVTSLTPTSGTTAGGTAVTITGTGFTGATGVTIGGVAATGVSVVSATSITATTPAGTAGTASVVVTTPAGSNAANTLFTYATPASTDATLSGLTYSSGVLTPAFASGTISYTQSVANSVSSITVTPTVNQVNATVTVNGTAVATGVASGSINLNVGANTITTVVTAQDGTTTKTYTTTVTRAAALQTQATLVASASPSALNATTTTSTLSTSGGSGTGAVSYVMSAGTCSLSGTTVTAGTTNETCTVTATKAADSTYTTATATVAITVSRRATLAAAATDASVAKTQATQLMQTQKFVQAQVQNITSHLDTFRNNFNLMPSNMGVSVNTPSLGQMSPLFYKVKDVWSGNSGESTVSDLRKAGMKNTDQSSSDDKLYNDYNKPEEIDEQAAIDQRIYAYERKQETYSFWSVGTIDTGLFKTGDAKDVSNKFRVNGLTFGLDYKVGPRAIVGAALGVGQGTNAAQELQSTVKSTQLSFTGYGMLGFGNNWVVDGLLGYSGLSFTGGRTTSDGSATLGMNRTGESAFASSSISKIFSFGSFRIAPFLREDMMQIRLGQYTETGAADYALGYDKAKYIARTSSAGLHFSNDIYLARGKLTTSAKFSANRMSTGSISQDVYYADTGMADGIYTLQQNSSYQSSRSLSLGIMYSNKAGDGVDIGWMGAMGANQYKLNGLRFGMHFAM